MHGGADHRRLHLRAGDDLGLARDGFDEADGGSRGLGSRHGREQQQQYSRLEHGEISLVEVSV